MSQIWRKPSQQDPDALIQAFCVGQDPVLDQHLAVWDIIGSIAHSQMLAKVGLISTDEATAIKSVLAGLFDQAQQKALVFEAGDEDIHTLLERILTEKLGDAGKKVHTGRSRNDQVLTALKLFVRHETFELVKATEGLASSLLGLAEQTKGIIIPGFTHTQVAMPSSAGLWLSAYAESMAEDIKLFEALWKFCQRSPLGSGAGYGGSLPLDRSYAASLLGFEGLNTNVVNAQMGRGRLEWLATTAIAGLANTIGRFADDICLYNAQFLGLITLDEAFTTGSSIMPHKRNPDVFELIRAECNLLKGLPNEVLMLTTNQISGYHRDNQLLKPILVRAIDKIKTILAIVERSLQGLKFNQGAVTDARFKDMYSVEAVNELVIKGIPFREAYKLVGEQPESFEAGFKRDHSLEGSVHNLQLDQIREYLEQQVGAFELERYQNWLAEMTGEMSS